MAVIELEDHGEENQTAPLAYLRRCDQCTGAVERA